jgi:hypothetical protein
MPLGPPDTNTRWRISSITVGLRTVVLAGEPRNLAVFRTHVPPRPADRIVGEVAGARYEPMSALAERAAGGDVASFDVHAGLQRAGGVAALLRYATAVGSRLTPGA